MDNLICAGSSANAERGTNTADAVRTALAQLLAAPATAANGVGYRRLPAGRLLSGRRGEAERIPAPAGSIRTAGDAWAEPECSSPAGHSAKGNSRRQPVSPLPFAATSSRR